MRSPRQPSIEDAQRALYVDFEGTAVDPPSFLGVCWAEGGDVRFRQYVLEEALWPAAAATRSAKTTGTCLRAHDVEALDEIRALAERDGRRLYAWTNHDLDCIRQMALDSDLAAWYEESLQNALPLARRWRRRVHPSAVLPSEPGRRRANALANYLRLIDYDVPKAFGPGNSANRIRYVRQMLALRGGDYASLTPVAKGKWIKALKHNWYDCDGLRTLVCTIAADGWEV